MQGYDIIGDVHGCATQLEALLDELGYRPDGTGAYRHPDRIAVFVGDLVDRGRGQLRVLEIVKRMVDSASAQIVMGNHEFNAIAYSIEHPVGSGQYLRRHTDKNHAQHKAFLEQVTGEDRAYYLDWFKTLPLWLDLGDICVIHACWHEESMKVVERELGSNRFSSPDQFVAATDKRQPLYGPIEVLLKGPEISLVEYGQEPYVDKDGHVRKRARVRWWNENATTLRELAEMGGDFKTEDGAPYPLLPNIEVPAGMRSYVYTGGVPVFYGHYWRNGSPKHLLDWTAYTACVDFSVVKGGTLTAYRWSGEKRIQLDHYVPHSGDVVAQQPSA